MTTSEIGARYATGLSRQHIEQALIAAGKDTAHLAPADLGALEDFHSLCALLRSLEGAASHRSGIRSAVARARRGPR